MNKQLRNKQISRQSTTRRRFLFGIFKSLESSVNQIYHTKYNHTSFLYGAPLRPDPENQPLFLQSDEIPFLNELIATTVKIVKLSVSVRQAMLGLFYDFVRIEWGQLSEEERNSTKRSVFRLFSSTNQKQISRIISEIAIREWPQMWPEFTDFICQAGDAVDVIRTCAEIQFQDWL